MIEMHGVHIEEPGESASAPIDDVLSFNERGVAESLTVRLFEPSGAQAGDPYEATYLPKFVSQSTKRKRKNFNGQITYQFNDFSNF